MRRSQIAGLVLVWRFSLVSAICCTALLLPTTSEVNAADSASAKTAKQAKSKTAEQGKTALSDETKSVENAYFAAGCFWKVQYIFSKVPGVIATKAGYTGGKTENPNYGQVCSHTTGHAETVRVEFDPKKVSYKKLLEVFWSHHDPTTLNRQGPDIGDQYRSEVFYANAAQKEEAQNYLAELQKSRKFSSPIVTKLEPIGQFYDAEEYHQDYFKKHGQSCD